MKKYLIKKHLQFITKRTVYILLAVVFFSCSKTNKIVYENDLEKIDGWGCASSVIMKGDAHSGAYMCMIDQTKPYSVTFKKKLKDITDKNIHIVEVEAWLKIDSINSRSSIIFTADSSEGRSAFWQQQPTDYLVMETGKWTRVRAQFYMPENVKPDYNILVYIWQKNEGATFVDDLTVRFTHE